MGIRGPFASICHATRKLIYGISFDFIALLAYIAKSWWWCCQLFLDNLSLQVQLLHDITYYLSKYVNLGVRTRLNAN